MARRRKKRSKDKEPSAVPSVAVPRRPESEGPFAGLRALLGELPACRPTKTPSPPRSATDQPAEEPEPSPPPREEQEADFEKEMAGLGVSEMPDAPRRVRAETVAEGPRQKSPGLGSRQERAPEGEEQARRAGKPEIKARPLLDLHGLGVDDALHTLRSFLTLHRGAGSRHLRVLTGHGKHSVDGHSPLRAAVVESLGRNSAVAGFGPAPSRDGGRGMILVELKG